MAEWTTEVRDLSLILGILASVVILYCLYFYRLWKKGKLISTLVATAAPDIKGHPDDIELQDFSQKESEEEASNSESDTEVKKFHGIDRPDIENYSKVLDQIKDMASAIQVRYSSESTLYCSEENFGRNISSGSDEVFEMEEVTA